jgi:Ser/Thr protein kinase RdoA (MazF antagonist)
MEEMSMNWSLDDEALQKKLVAVAHYFELGSLLSSRRAGGYANTTYFVTTNKGEYVVKWLLPAKFEKLQQEWLYLQRLMLHGFPAAPYVQTPDDAFVYQKGNEIAVALKKLPGHHPHPSKEVNKQIGSTLALLHTIPTQTLPRKNSWLEKAYLADAIDFVKSHVSVKELQPVLYEYEQVRHFDPTRYPQTIVHGDLVPHNCLFEGLELSAVLDWEEVCIGAAIQDFAVCVLNFCFSLQGFDRDLYHALYESYTSIRHLSNEERSITERAVKYMGITGAVAFLVQFGVNYPDEHQPAYQFYWRLGIDQWTLQE